MKRAVLVALFFVALGTSPQGVSQGGTHPVLDADTALKLAEPVLVSIYGKRLIDYERPFSARLVRDIWIVSGTLCCPDSTGQRTCQPFQCVGGVAELKLRQRDGKVLSVYHGK